MGEADPGVQAYTFRVCLTDVPGDRVPLTRRWRTRPRKLEARPSRNS